MRNKQAYNVKICNCDVQMKVQQKKLDLNEFDSLKVIMSQANTLLACNIVSVEQAYWLT